MENLLAQEFIITLLIMQSELGKLIQKRLASLKCFCFEQSF